MQLMFHSAMIQTDLRSYKNFNDISAEKSDFFSFKTPTIISEKLSRQENCIEIAF